MQTPVLQRMTTRRQPLRPRASRRRKQLSEEEYGPLAATLRETYAQPATNWPAPHIDDEIKPGFPVIGLLPLVVFLPTIPTATPKSELGEKLSL